MIEKENKSTQLNFFERDSVRKNTDIITDKIDEQLIENIKILQERRSYEEELLASLHKINSHSLCPSALPTCDDLKKSVSKPDVKEEVKEIKEVHGEDCHCSKCCPNPNPNFFQKNKQAILLGLLWIAMIVLAVGWSPSGEAFQAIQESYVDLLVNFFKMGIFAVAGIVTYNLFKKNGD